MTSKARQTGGLTNFIPGLILCAMLAAGGALLMAGYTFMSWVATLTGFVLVGVADALGNNDTERD